MTCRGCERPPGLTDEGVRGVLAAAVAERLPATALWMALVPRLYGDDFGAGNHNRWHVVAWVRCGDTSPQIRGPGQPDACDAGVRCHFRDGHEGRHRIEGGHASSWWFSSPGRLSGGRGTPPPPGDPTWPVPCWVTTAEDAERWRPVARETAVVSGERVPVATTMREAMDDAMINGEVFYRVPRGPEPDFPVYINGELCHFASPEDAQRAIDDHAVPPSFTVTDACAFPCHCSAPCTTAQPAGHWPHRCERCATVAEPAPTLVVHPGEFVYVTNPTPRARELLADYESWRESQAARSRADRLTTGQRVDCDEPCDRCGRPGTECALQAEHSVARQHLCGPCYGAVLVEEADAERGARDTSRLSPAAGVDGLRGRSWLADAVEALDPRTTGAELDRVASLTTPTRGNRDDAELRADIVAGERPPTYQEFMAAARPWTVGDWAVVRFGADFESGPQQIRSVQGEWLHFVGGCRHIHSACHRVPAPVREVQNEEDARGRREGPCVRCGAVSRVAHQRMCFACLSAVLAEFNRDDAAAPVPAPVQPGGAGEWRVGDVVQRSQSPGSLRGRVNHVGRDLLNVTLIGGENDGWQGDWPASACRRVEGPGVSVTAPDGAVLPDMTGARVNRASGEVYEITGVNSVTQEPGGGVSVGYAARRVDRPDRDSVINQLASVYAESIMDLRRTSAELIRDDIASRLRASLASHPPGTRAAVQAFVARHGGRYEEGPPGSFEVRVWGLTAEQRQEMNDTVIPFGVRLVDMGPSPRESADNRGRHWYVPASVEFAGTWQFAELRGVTPVRFDVVTSSGDRALWEVRDTNGQRHPEATAAVYFAAGIQALARWQPPPGPADHFAEATRALTTWLTWPGRAWRERGERRARVLAGDHARAVTRALVNNNLRVGSGGLPIDEGDHG